MRELRRYIVKRFRVATPQYAHALKAQLGFPAYHGPSFLSSCWLYCAIVLSRVRSYGFIFATIVFGER